MDFKIDKSHPDYHTVKLKKHHMILHPEGPVAGHVHAKGKGYQIRDVHKSHPEAKLHPTFHSAASELIRRGNQSVPLSALKEEAPARHSFPTYKHFDIASMGYHHKQAEKHKADAARHKGEGNKIDAQKSLRHAQHHLQKKEQHRQWSKASWKKGAGNRMERHFSEANERWVRVAHVERASKEWGSPSSSKIEHLKSKGIPARVSRLGSELEGHVAIEVPEKHAKRAEKHLWK